MEENKEIVIETTPCEVMNVADVVDVSGGSGISPVASGITGFIFGVAATLIGRYLFKKRAEKKLKKMEEQNHEPDEEE